MKIKLVGKLGNTKGDTLFELDLTWLVLLYAYGPGGLSPNKAPIHAVDLFADDKLVPWPEDLAEVF